MKKIFALNRNHRSSDTVQVQKPAHETFERCVLCGRATDVPVMQPIGERRCYVIGAGQLCAECCMNLYGTTDLIHTAESEIC